jgi:hypothetical protein
MTTPPTNSDRAEADRAIADAAWAAEQLRLSTPVDAAASRRVLLRELRTHEFLPPPDWQTCADLVLQQPRTEMNPAIAITTGRRDVLRERVEAFAAEFFSIPPAARRARWNELIGLCRPHAPLAQRLALLGPGLDLDVSNQSANLNLSGSRGDSPEVSQQAAELRELILRMFVLRPRARAELSLSLHERVESAPTSWEKAAKLLERRDPAVAKLNGWLIEELKNWSKLEARGTRVLKAQLKRARAQLKRARMQQPRAVVTSRSETRNLILIIIGIAVGIAMAASISGTRKSQRQPSPPPQSESLAETLLKLQQLKQEIENTKSGGRTIEPEFKSPAPTWDALPPVPPPPPSMRDDFQIVEPRKSPDQSDAKKDSDGKSEPREAGEQVPR